MLQPGILLCQLIYLTACVSGLAITRDVDQNALLLNTMPTATRVAPSEQIQTHTLVPPTTIPFPTTRTEAPAVTEPPSTTANLQRRQPCCFNEQGFRVDCATWTGYYYTWGPQGNPYQGGPQCDGNWNGGSGGSGLNGNGQGGGNGNNNVAILNGSAEETSRVQVSLVLGAGLLVLAALL